MDIRYVETADGLGPVHALELDHGLHDAGEGVSFTYFYDDPNKTKPIGIYWWHNCPAYRTGPNGEEYPDRPGQATFERWGVDSADPLTLQGSLLCLSCNRHGFIRDGVWVECW